MEEFFKKNFPNAYFYNGSNGIFYINDEKVLQDLKNKALNYTPPKNVESKDKLAEIEAKQKLAEIEAKQKLAEIEAKQKAAFFYKDAKRSDSKEPEQKQKQQNVDPISEQKDEKKSDKNKQDYEGLRKFTIDYLESLDKRNPSIETMANELESKLTAEEEKKLEKFLDPVHETILRRPVDFNGNLYDLHTLLAFVGKNDPLTNEYKVEKVDIQPARQAADELYKVLKEIYDIRQKAVQKQDAEIDPNRPKPPGGLS